MPIGKEEAVVGAAQEAAAEAVVAAVRLRKRRRSIMLRVSQTVGDRFRTRMVLSN